MKFTFYHPNLSWFEDLKSYGKMDLLSCIILTERSNMIHSLSMV